MSGVPSGSMGEMALEYSSRKDTTPSRRATAGRQIRAAEHQQRVCLDGRESLDQLALGVRLLEHPRLDVAGFDPSSVALGLDREDPARPDDHVVDIAAPGGHIVDR